MSEQPTVAEAPVPGPDTSHWDEARQSSYGRLHDLRAPIARSALNAINLKVAADGIMNMGEWVSLPGGQDFWSSLYEYLCALQAYAKHADAPYPEVPENLAPMLEQGSVR